MSQRERRLQRIAVLAAVAALAIAVLAVIVRRRPGPGDALRRTVPVAALARLAPATTQAAEAGVRITDSKLAAALGLAADDQIAAISGRALTTPDQLATVLDELASFQPTAWFVDVAHAGALRLERWELDADFADARRAAPPAAPRPGARPSDPLQSTIRRLSATRFELPRATVDAWLADPARVTAGVASLQQRHSPEGLALALHPGSVLAALGLQSGDVIRGLDGTEVSLATLLPTLARATTRLTVDVQRNGQAVILDYVIR